MTMAQATLRVHLRDCLALAAAATLLLAAFVACDLATISHVRHAEGVVVRHARGVVDGHRAFTWSRPAFRLARWRAEPLPFTCLDAARAALRCPSTADWTARDLSVDWIDCQRASRASSCIAPRA